jgi:hypothetical protein
MSSFPKLNIDIRDLSKKPKKLQFVIQSEPEPPPKKSKPVNYYLFVIGLLCVCIIFMFSSRSSSPSLRKIIRMSCSTSNGIQVCTAYGQGEYVVNTEGCSTYEFNGVPFTELLEIEGNYRIPPSPDMSIRVVDACPTILATMDTRRVIPSDREYARKGMPYNKRVVWVTDNCYKDFTLRIGSELIFDHTPAKMIDHKMLNNYTAYVYESPGVSGGVFVTGSGCNKPIEIYSI